MNEQNVGLYLNFPEIGLMNGVATMTPIKPSDAGCKIHQFLDSGQADDVLRLIERTNKGLPRDMLQNWKPAESAFLECPYFQMTGEHSDQCKDDCQLYELAFILEKKKDGDKS